MKPSTQNSRFTLRSPAIDEDAQIKRAHTCEGADIPPPIGWSLLPKGAKSLALIMDDPDARVGTFTHWLVWDIPATDDDSEPVHVERVGVPGQNDFHGIGYDGPRPAPGLGPRRYRLFLHAIDVPSLDLDYGATRGELEDAMRGHVLARAEVVAHYER